MKFDLMGFLVEKILPAFWIFAAAVCVAFAIAAIVDSIREPQPRMFVLRDSASKQGLECVKFQKTLDCNWDKYNAATGGP